MGLRRAERGHLARERRDLGLLDAAEQAAEVCGFIRATIRAGANAIIWTPPSAQQLQTDMMQRYRKMKEDATPVISRDDVPIIDQVAAAEVSQVENMNPDVPIPDEVIERVASIHERVEEHRANRGLKPSLHGFFFRGKKR